MASLRDIRGRIDSVKSTEQVTRAMKMVAAAKLRKAQEMIFASRPYAFKLRELKNNLRHFTDSSSHPLFQEREEVRNVLLIVVTGDRGLAGAFNTNILKLTEELVREQYSEHQESGRLKLICVGKKAHEYFERRGYELVGDYRGFFNKLSFGATDKLVDVAIDGFLAEDWDEVKVLYNEFKNTISQNKIVEPLLPVSDEEFITPLMKASELYTPEAEHQYALDYIWEPDADTILKELIPRYLNFQLWRIVLESNAAEQGARMVAMDNATTNAGELLKELKLKYNRARQAAITTEILEISSGAEALAKQG